MKKTSPASPRGTRPGHSRLAVFSLALLALAPALPAQVNTEFQITKIDPQLVTTPMVSYSGATQKPNPLKKWLEIETSFLWQPRSLNDKFTDEVVFNYYVLLANKSATNPTGSLLTGQAAHASIPAKQVEAKDLKTVIYLSPRSILRLFDGKEPSSPASAIVDIGVTITCKGQIVAEKSFKGTGAWWPQFQQTGGYLLDKSDTPFAPLNWDYYETFKKP